MLHQDYCHMLEQFGRLLLLPDTEMLEVVHLRWKVDFCILSQLFRSHAQVIHLKVLIVRKCYGWTLGKCVCLSIESH